MIVNKVYKLKEDATLTKELVFKRFQEFEVVNDVVYMNGFMLPPDLQPLFYKWLTENENLFTDATKNW